MAAHRIFIKVSIDQNPRPDFNMVAVAGVAHE